MDGFIGLSSRRLHRYTNNLGVQKIGVYNNNMRSESLGKLQVVGYFESSVSGSTILGSPGIQSPPMYLKNGDVVYVIGCEGYIGSTTGSTAAATFTGQGNGGQWQPFITNVRTGVNSFASHNEAAMLNARQNQWSPSAFQSTPTNDWASVVTGQTAVLGTYRTFLSLRIIRVTETDMYTINTQYGPRGTGSQARHVYCVAYRGVDVDNLSNVYYEPSGAQTRFVKSPRSRIATGTYLIGAYDGHYFNGNIFNVDPFFFPGRVGFMTIGMLSELDLINSDGDRVKTDGVYGAGTNNWIGNLWSDQYDGGGGLSSVCGISFPGNVDYGLTFNHSGVRAITASLIISTCYEILIPTL